MNHVLWSSIEVGNARRVGGGHFDRGRRPVRTTYVGCSALGLASINLIVKRKLLTH